MRLLKPGKMPLKEQQRKLGDSHLSPNLGLLVSNRPLAKRVNQHDHVLLLASDGYGEEGCVLQNAVATGRVPAADAGAACA